MTIRSMPSACTAREEPWVHSTGVFARGAINPIFKDARGTRCRWAGWMATGCRCRISWWRGNRLDVSIVGTLVLLKIVDMLVGLG